MFYTYFYYLLPTHIYSLYYGFIKSIAFVIYRVHRPRFIFMIIIHIYSSFISLSYHLQFRFNTADGCATNGVAKAVFSECCDLICVSHTSNLHMKLFEKATPVAHQFLQAWSQSLTQGSKVRAAARRALGEAAMKNHPIRWIAQYRAAVQVSANYFLIKDIILNEDVGCDNLMATLRGIINEPADNNLASSEDILRLELALIKDAGEPIASFCNFFEGDGFLAPYAYDSWNSLNNHLRVVVNRYTERNCPYTCPEIVMEIAEGSEELQQALMEVTVAKAITVMEKL